MDDGIMRVDPMDLQMDDDDFNVSQEFLQQVDQLATQYYETTIVTKKRRVSEEPETNYKNEFLAKDGEAKLLRAEVQKLREELVRKDKAVLFEKNEKLRQMEDFCKRSRLVEFQHRDIVRKMKANMGYQERKAQEALNESRLAVTSEKTSVPVVSKKILKHEAVQTSAANFRNVRESRGKLTSENVDLLKSFWPWKPSADLRHALVTSAIGNDRQPHAIVHQNLETALSLLVELSSDPRQFSSNRGLLQLEDAESLAKAFSVKRPRCVSEELVYKCLLLETRCRDYKVSRQHRFIAGKLSEEVLCMHLRIAEKLNSALTNAVIAMASNWILERDSSSMCILGFSTLEVLLLSEVAHSGNCTNPRQAEESLECIFSTALLNACKDEAWTGRALKFLMAGVSGHGETRTASESSGVCRVALAAAEFGVELISATLDQHCDDKSFVGNCVRFLELITVGRDLIGSYLKVGGIVEVIKMRLKSLGVGPGIGEESTPTDDAHQDDEVLRKMDTLRKMMPSNACDPRSLTLDTRARADSTKQPSRRDKFRSLYWKNSLRRKHRDAQRARSVDTVDRVIVPENPETYMMEYLQNVTVGDETAMMDELKSMAEPLTLRRRVKRTLSQQAGRQKRKAKSIPLCSLMKYSISMGFRRFGLGLRESMRDWQLWNSSLKTIEGNFGTGIGSYFRFLRSLLLMDAVVGLLVLAFVIIPHWLAMANPEASQEIAINATDVVFREKPVWNVFYRNELGMSNKSQEDFRLQDLVTGEKMFMPSSVFAVFDWNIFGMVSQGYLRDSFLFYGTYTDKILTLYQNRDYYLPHAYFFALVVGMMLAIAIISRATASSFRQNFIARSGNRLAVVSLVLCGWDFNVTSKASARFRSKFIRKDLQEFAETLTKNVERWTWRRIGFMALTNAAVILIVGGLVVGFFFMLNSGSVDTGTPQDRDALHLYGVPILASTVMFVLPMVFSVLAEHEGYSNPRSQLYVTLIRSFLLQCAVLATVAYYCVNLSKKEEVECWETTFGSMVYRLVMMDFLLVVLLGSAADWLRAQISKQIKLSQTETKSKVGMIFSPPVFDVARNTMNLVYNQSLLWLGFFYCPFLPLIAVAKYFVTFFFNKYELLLVCDKQRQKMWRAAQANSVFLGLAFSSNLITMAFLFYSMSTFPSSGSCGPFVALRFSGDLVVDILDDWDKSSDFLLSVLVFLQGSWPKAVAFMIILAFLFYLREVCEGHRQITERLMTQLKELRSDKAYFFKEIEKQYALRRGLPNAMTREDLNNFGRKSYIRGLSMDESRNSFTSRESFLPGRIRGQGDAELIPMQHMRPVEAAETEVLVTLQDHDEESDEETGPGIASTPAAGHNPEWNPRLIQSWRVCGQMRQLEPEVGDCGRRESVERVLIVAAIVKIRFETRVAVLCVFAIRFKVVVAVGVDENSVDNQMFQTANKAGIGYSTFDGMNTPRFNPYLSNNSSPSDDGRSSPESIREMLPVSYASVEDYIRVTNDIYSHPSVTSQRNFHPEPTSSSMMRNYSVAPSAPSFVVVPDPRKVSKPAGSVLLRRTNNNLPRSPDVILPTKATVQPQQQGWNSAQNSIPSRFGSNHGNIGQDDGLNSARSGSALLRRTNNAASHRRF
ncbi:unnamed protein product [Notodromas monacha]|uniref:TMC domain-containing protein n=1 Tax=Notodromas monacha TaxID=399045 RepID=A0A7R9GB82_9CRUS|nr:unnamed protein product [Notodromas monacha]CAG0916230.1 unnamed protein product [Notodromas monacha]